MDKCARVPRASAAAATYLRAYRTSARSQGSSGPLCFNRTMFSPRDYAFSSSCHLAERAGGQASRSVLDLSASLKSRGLSDV